MPSWTSSADRTGQGLVAGISFDGKGSSRTRSSHSSGRVGSWKNTLNDIGWGLVRGESFKGEKSLDGSGTSSNVPLLMSFLILG
jgi:hypothetical protein